MSACEFVGLNLVVGVCVGMNMSLDVLQAACCKRRSHNIISSLNIENIIIYIHFCVHKEHMRLNVKASFLMLGRSHKPADEQPSLH